MFWMIVVVAGALAIIGASFIVFGDTLVYLDLQRRLKKEREKRVT